MGKVVPIKPKSKWSQGPARCLACHFEWWVVVPEDTYEFECLQCGCLTGVFSAMFAPGFVWRCNCGCEHFYIVPTGCICAKCGKEQSGYAGGGE